MGKQVNLQNATYHKLVALRKGMDTFTDVIERLLDEEEETPHAKGVKRPKAERPEAQEESEEE